MIYQKGGVAGNLRRILKFRPSKLGLIVWSFNWDRLEAEEFKTHIVRKIFDEVSLKRGQSRK